MLHEPGGLELDREAVEVGRVQRLGVVLVFARGVACGDRRHEGDVLARRPEAPLVQDPQQHVQRLPGGAGDVVEDADLGGEEAARDGGGLDDLPPAPPRRLLPHDDRLAGEVGEARVAWEERSE